MRPIRVRQEAKRAASIDELADYFLANGAGMSPKEALSKIQAWNSGKAPAALAAVKPGAKTQMLNYKGEQSCRRRPST